MHTNIVLRQLLESDARIRSALRKVTKDLPRSMDQHTLAELVHVVLRANQLVVLNYNNGHPDAITGIRQGSPYHSVPDEIIDNLYFFRLSRAVNPSGAYQYQSVEHMMDPKWGRGRVVVSVEIMNDPR